MVLVRHNVHAAALSPPMQKKVVHLRDKKGLPFWKIAEKVWNLRRDRPSTQHCLDVYNSFGDQAAAGYKKDNYHKCGRSAWKLTEPVKKFLVKRLLSLRGKCICTSTTLQEHLVREKHVKVDTSKIRQLLRDEGFKWARRNQKRIYSQAQREERVKFAKALLRLTKAALSRKLSMCVLSSRMRNPTSHSNSKFVPE